MAPAVFFLGSGLLTTLLPERDDALILPPGLGELCLTREESPSIEILGKRAPYRPSGRARSDEEGSGPGEPPRGEPAGHFHEASSYSNFLPARDEVKTG
jgi:hypothetical protein